MRRASLSLLFVLASSALAQKPAARWPLQTERLMAADAASYAPEDFKRMLAKNRDRLMAGVSDAAAAENGRRDAQAHRAAAAKGARAIGAMIREHHTFGDVAYEVGGLVHELAAAFPPGDASSAAAAGKRSSFLGYSLEPFGSPETLTSASLPSASSRAAYDAATSLSTRLLAWIWKTAGGDAGIVTRHPETKGPYTIRE